MALSDAARAHIAAELAAWRANLPDRRSETIRATVTPIVHKLFAFYGRDIFLELHQAASDLFATDGLVPPRNVLLDWLAAQDHDARAWWRRRKRTREWTR